MPQLQWPHLPSNEPGWPRGLCAEREAGHSQLGPGRTGSSSGESLSALGRIWARGVGADSIGQTGDISSFLQIDELVSPEPEPLNTSEFSDWSSFNGKW